MSPVALGLDALLILLLVTAVAVGLRLNRKLKDLKESQAGFIRAVRELDGAAMRAESGLAALREATTEAHDQLLNRIEAARGLCARLDRILPETEAASAQALAAAEAANDAAAAARRAAAVRPAPPRAASDEVVVPLRARAAVETDFEVPTAADEAAAERAAALFLEQRALRLGAAPSNDVDGRREEAASPLSRLDRFKARRAGAHA